ncbi:DUF3025 domain-containing protein [Noviherbaspirillum cavernae]|uniref:DUF3025 domain-containing protein n=1 Tax=Noviherbaspirillum cavernae TaxID=2320862 RepID=A0A418X417_9BURK|nr:DUF3025 domain-containing protein [Noviherbaspirillum cavernae]RJG07179.1 DUF3025 domain-containing protein [Noviherbaspirillum cavernae]
MSPQILKLIDWSRPWLAPLLPTVEPILAGANWHQDINEIATRIGLENHCGLPVRFVAQADLPLGTPYEAFISATGGVPTRDNLHDFFNALVWLTFPKIKTQLNALQAAEIFKHTASPGIPHPHGASRGKLRDAATIFDENAALLVARDAQIVDALCNHRWHDVFQTRRAAFGSDWEVWPFGHALMEKLVTPYKSITAHALPVMAGDGFFAMPFEEKRRWLDAVASRHLAAGVSTAEFTPLPILGIPGWWHEQDDAFYGDTTVFRPKKVRGAVGPSA